jgi:heat shock protein 4
MAEAARQAAMAQEAATKDEEMTDAEAAKPDQVEEAK